MPIRRYLNGDYPKVLELIRAVYDENAYKIASQRFQWQYKTNPNNGPQDPLIYVVEENNAIVGMLCAFAQKVKIGNRIYPAYWLGDLMVHPDFRASYNGLRLVREMVTNPYLGMGFPAEYLIKIYFRVGAIQFSQLLRFSRTIQPSFKEKQNIATKLKNFVNHKILSGVKIIEINHFDERFDRLWENASKDYQALQVRDSVFLNWRFTQCPHISYRILTAIIKDEVLGYMVLREIDHGGFREGSIVDLFTDRSNNAVIPVLMQAGIKFFTHNNCKVIKMTISSTDVLLTKALQNFSFMDCEKIDRGLIYCNTGINLNSIINEFSDWFLTRADSDMDFSE
ncbi:MAG: GNAT family N-acetyltransferase [Candidatus Omnitrophica bacterium]|nr:GNAT family N-acetyltransferase [Candidatus Omnitrophota bacterium]